ncbi:T9SS C-terminal target domain-containing protein [Chryseobacterium nematophagum]|uniref:T9SS C-terminal target domain-containing protein n=2 Tax=Chryseobacterium nematophagum TaxID=2305228 RepID=A0A3M7TJ83_9FLAO|nr:T9SS C-terminal target domain-containing protein [Chryseobacterium nematophagum]
MMTKNLFIDSAFKRKFLSGSIIFGLSLSVCSVHAQICQNTISMPANGSINVAGVNGSVSSTGSVTAAVGVFLGSCPGVDILSTGGSLDVGVNGSWSTTISFNTPVNNIAFVISGADTLTRYEDFIFNSNGGGISIFPANSCGMNISGNTIAAAPGGLGAGVYAIHASSPYTQITISGGGGSGGSRIGICSASFLGAQEIKNIGNSTVDIYPSQVKDVMTISSKENLKSYKIFDEAGKLISSAPLGINKKEVNMSGIMPGNYIISVETQTQTVNKKIIKH